VSRVDLGLRFGSALGAAQFGVAALFFFSEGVLAGLDAGSVALASRHAWITTDGVHAIDPTWTEPEGAAYFGVPIADAALLARLVLEGNGLLSPLQRIVFGK
jgi:hypothetical protein